MREKKGLTVNASTSLFSVLAVFVNPWEKQGGKTLLAVHHLLSVAVHSKGMAEDHSATCLQV